MTHIHKLREIVEQAVRSTILACKSATGQYAQIDKYVNGTHITNTVVGETLAAKPVQKLGASVRVRTITPGGVECWEKPTLKPQHSRESYSIDADPLGIRARIVGKEPAPDVRELVDAAKKFVNVMDQCGDWPDTTDERLNLASVKQEIIAALAKHGVQS